MNDASEIEDGISEPDNTVLFRNWVVSLYN